MKNNTCLILLILNSFTLSCSNTETGSEASIFRQDTIKVRGLYDLYNQGTESIVFDSERENYIIGNIQEAKINDGLIYILDNIIPNVLVVNKDGTLVQEIGQSGRGPGEYINPVSLEVSKGGLVLLDQSLGRITRYIYNQTTEKYDLDISGVHNIRFSDLCMSDSGNIWVYGLKDNFIIHKLSMDLQTITFSSGLGININDRVTIERAHNGVIECTSEFVFIGFKTDNKIRVHSKTNGLLHAEIHFDKIVPVEISMMNYNGQTGFARKYYQGLAYDERGNFHDSLRNIILINDVLLVQYERYFVNANSSSQQVISFLVNLQDITYEMISTLPIIFDYEYDKIFLTGGNNPAPFVKLISQTP